MKIALTGVTSFRNRGVEALTATILAEYRRRLPGAQFVVMDRSPEYDAFRLKAPDVRFRYDETARPLYVSRLRRLLLKGSALFKPLGRDYQAALEEIRSADAVIATGGDIFGSEYGHRSLLSHLAPLQAARKAGKPFFLHAHSIGPFKNEQDKAAFVETARDAAFITVRERKSYEYVLQELGFPKEKTALCADPAFLLKPTPAPWRAYFQIPQDAPLVALTPSQAVCNWMGSDYDKHLETWSVVVETILKEFKARILFVPHVQEISPYNDDRVLATALLRRFQYDPRLQIAGGDFAAADFKGMIKQCDMAISERMHAAIAGLSTAVPTLAVGYSVKAEGILADLLDAERARRSALIRLDEFLEPANARRRVRELWADRAMIRRELADRIAPVRALAVKAFDIVAGLLKRER